MIIRETCSLLRLKACGKTFVMQQTACFCCDRRVFESPRAIPKGSHMPCYNDKVPGMSYAWHRSVAGNRHRPMWFDAFERSVHTLSKARNCMILCCSCEKRWAAIALHRGKTPPTTPVTARGEPLNKSSSRPERATAFSFARFNSCRPKLSDALNIKPLLRRFLQKLGLGSNPSAGLPPKQAETT